ncbi:RsfA family transcriptional regulator [Thalassorhabdus alkalitolerans]|uniref:RsfA family transcriptional regulator n=1 Tax=Thalassorhabdus alkalitolerans TaxID=2282697 RepID=A0ABW0YJF6_9BACI|nr:MULTISPECIES: RsfA family transcriptional regulator [Bacillaceae]
MNKRRDAWTEEQDQLLTDTVLAHIKKGSTQLKAFEEVGDELNRSSSACGFRWNAILRDKNKKQIELAKKERKMRTEDKRKESAAPPETGTASTITIPDIISYLEEISSSVNGLSQEKFEELITQRNELQLENKKLHAIIADLKEEYEAVYKDYKTLMELMDRARKRDAG